MRWFFSFISIMLMTSTQARLFLNVSIINKKGIDIGLTLGSELHSVEEVRSSQPIELKMKSGIKVILETEFIEISSKLEEKEVYGPISKIKVRGKILNFDDNVLKDFRKEPLLISLEEEHKVIYSQSSQLVEIILKPYLK